MLLLHVLLNQRIQDKYVLVFKSKLMTKLEIIPYAICKSILILSTDKETFIAKLIVKRFHVDELFS